MVRDSGGGGGENCLSGGGGGDNGVGCDRGGGGVNGGGMNGGGDGNGICMADFLRKLGPCEEERRCKTDDVWGGDDGNEGDAVGGRALESGNDAGERGGGRGPEGVSRVLGGGGVERGGGSGCRERSDGGVVTGCDSIRGLGRRLAMGVARVFPGEIGRGGRPRGRTSVDPLRATGDIGTGIGGEGSGPLMLCVCVVFLCGELKRKKLIVLHFARRGIFVILSTFPCTEFFLHNKNPG